jgi:hypothetical protein
MKAIQKCLLAFVILCLPHALATNITLGAQGGSASAAKGSFETSLGYGAFIQASALDILTLQADYFTAQTNSLHKRALSSDLLFHLLNFDRLKVGLLAGPGFYQNKDDRWRFGLNGGAFGEFSLLSRIPLGLQVRYHSAFSGEDHDLWSLFLTLGFRFGSGSDW